MSADPFKVVRDFEAALCEYTGAPYCVTTTSCTMALLLATHLAIAQDTTTTRLSGNRLAVVIPKRTYIGVPMSIIHAGGWPMFDDRDWSWRGSYQLKPLPVYDSARWFSGGMWSALEGMVCLSFHWNKTLGIQQGGAILHDNPEADRWLRKARFDGRTEGVAPADDIYDVLGWHCYMAPETAAAGLVRLAHLPKHNDPLPNDDYPDLSKLEVFK